jgi:AraC family transcriptional regulator, transcriptional activator of pobA
LPVVKKKNNVPLLSLRHPGDDDDQLFVISELNSSTTPPNHPLFVPFRQDYYFFFLPSASDPGSHRRWIDFISYEWQPGNLYFSLPGHVHLVEETAQLSGALLAFTGDFLPPEDWNSRKKLPILQNPDDIHELKLSGEERDFLNNLFIQMQSRYSGSQDGNAGIMRSYLNIFLVYLSRIYTRQFNARPLTGDPMQINRLKELLNEEYDPIRQVADYARLLETTPSGLNDMARAYAGKTATLLVQERVILEAKRAIVMGNLSLKEIAGSLGFEDSGFVRFFKRVTGETPASFRSALQAVEG